MVRHVAGRRSGSVLVSLSQLQAAEGRFDLVTGGRQVFAIVDCRHHTDALHNVLSTLIQVGNVPVRQLHLRVDAAETGIKRKDRRWPG
jgi:UDP-N-acetylmuramyl tripeptide synthase